MCRITFSYSLILGIMFGLRSLCSSFKPFSVKSIRATKRSTFVLQSSPQSTYLAVHVFGKLVVGKSSHFYLETLKNAQNSVLERGISRFDVLRKEDDNDEFLLIEVYNSKSGPDEHKQTPHYNSWRDVVAPFMAQPRQAKKYNTIYPRASNWKTDPNAGSIDATAYSVAVPWNATPRTSRNGNSNSMLAVIVDIEVKPGTEEAFLTSSISNCKNSMREVSLIIARKYTHFKIHSSSSP